MHAHHPATRPEFPAACGMIEDQVQTKSLKWVQDVEEQDRRLPVPWLPDWAGVE